LQIDKNNDEIGLIKFFEQIKGEVKEVSFELEKFERKDFGLKKERKIGISVKIFIFD